ncbi:MAG TPA: ParB/RepB/Spo0J family partition protein [Candidatus Binataceae bacterium]
MMRKPLGRGLDALIESTVAQDGAAAAAQIMPGAAQIATVALDAISPGPYQPRTHFDAERLQELTRAIESQGVIEPLIVRPAPPDAVGARREADQSSRDTRGLPRYQLIAGERRLRAARAAGLATVPVIVRELDDRAALEMSLVENLAREELNAVEEGRAFDRLVTEFALSHDEVAARIGKSRPYVSNAIRLLELAPEVLDMIAAGALTAGQARPLLALKPAAAQIAAARSIVAGKISARGAEELVSAHRRRRNSSSARSVADANLNALADGIQRALKRKIRIVRRRGKTPGRIMMDYYDDNDLNALAATLTGGTRVTSAHA